MIRFINQDFLLCNKTAVRLYHEYAEGKPIIDFHCHLSPHMIADDRQFEDLGQAWLEGDHYKWRAMRTNGISEKYCTGDARPEEKFMKWAETVPMAAGNPLYHWTHLELARYFNIFDLLSPVTAEKIYEDATAMLKLKDFSTRSLIKRMNVELICTTDDPADDLSGHIRLKGNADFTVLPTWRPDAVIKIEDTQKFREYIEKLSAAGNKNITSFSDLIDVLDNRHKFFHEKESVGTHSGYLANGNRTLSGGIFL